jgi:GTP-binding protein
MEIKKAEFVKSMRQKKDYPDLNLPEIAVAGRSNSGKSSLINCLANNGSLAKVSGTPGKTRLVNFFKFHTDRTEFLLVDLPGYGYAKVPKGEKNAWTEMIEGYFAVTENLKALLVLMDIRHKPNDFDRQMLYYAQYHSVPFVVVATKADKIAKSKRPAYVKGLLGELGIQAGVPAAAFSSADRSGKGELLAIIEEHMGGAPV